MKTNLLKAFALAIAMTLFYNCSEEPADNQVLTENSTVIELNVQSINTDLQAFNCNGANPKARITNNGTVPFDYEIFDNSGILIIGIYNINPETVTDWIEFPEGTIIFNLENGIDSDQKVAHLMENCMEINMEINAENILIEAVPVASTN